MNDVVTVVCGFPRCGSSLTMQMLEAAGVPVVGSFPAFEDRRVLAPIERGWFASLSGRAVKILDPQLNVPPPEVPTQFLWLRRDHHQQAKSTLKFLRYLGTKVPQEPEVDLLRSLRRSLEEDQAKVRAVIGTRPAIAVPFEQILRGSPETLYSIARFVAPHRAGGHALMVAEMANCIWDRPARCAPDMEIEERLLEVAKARAARGLPIYGGLSL